MTDLQILGKLHDAAIEMQRAIEEARKSGLVPVRYFQDLLASWRTEIRRIEDRRAGAKQ